MSTVDVGDRIASPPDLASEPQQTANELLTRAGHGDQDAFAALYDHGCAPVYGLLRHMLGDDALAGEVAQEVWLELWRSATRYAPARGSAMTWVMTLAHRRAVDRLRATPVGSAPDRVAPRAVGTAGERPFGVAFGNRGHGQMRRCLRHLTPLQRQVLILAYYRGRTYREIRAALGLPLPIVNGRIRDGLIRLRGDGN